MENTQQKIFSLQRELGNLSLEAKRDRGGVEPDRILAGKLLTIRVYRRFTISEIVTKVWRLHLPVKVEKVGDNTFKFIFGAKWDREHIYKNRPWSLNGAHLILKPWLESQVLGDLSSASTTLWLQIHGFPPAVIQEGTAERIGNRVGKVHMETVTNRSVVAHSYIHIRVDIPIKDPIPASFFYARKDDEIWVQFKYEKLLDFCFRCGLMDHVTGRCKFGNPATLTSDHGVTAKIYGPWLKAEVPNGLNFVNKPEGQKDRHNFPRNRKAFESNPMVQSNRLLLEGAGAKGQVDKDI